MVEQQWGRTVVAFLLDAQLLGGIGRKAERPTYLSRSRLGGANQVLSSEQAGYSLRLDLRHALHVHGFQSVLGLFRQRQGGEEFGAEKVGLFGLGSIRARCWHRFIGDDFFSWFDLFLCLGLYRIYFLTVVVPLFAVLVVVVDFFGRRLMFPSVSRIRCCRRLLFHGGSGRSNFYLRFLLIVRLSLFFP